MADEAFDKAISDLESGPSSPAGDEQAAGDEASAETHPTVSALRARFGEAILHHAVMAGDEHVVRVALDRTIEILTWLKRETDQHYDFLADLTAIDWGGGRPLELVYQLWSIPHRRALRIKASVPLAQLEADSATSLWRTADWLEREVWDLFGIRFRGHPDLRRILMPEEYAEGHPLRKDFPLRGRFSRAEQTRRALSIPVNENYAEAELAVIEEVKAHRRSRDAAEESAQ